MCKLDLALAIDYWPFGDDKQHRIDELDSIVVEHRSRGILPPINLYQWLNLLQRQVMVDRLWLKFVAKWNQEPWPLSRAASLCIDAEMCDVYELHRRMDSEMVDMMWLGFEEQWKHKFQLDAVPYKLLISSWEQQRKEINRVHSLMVGLLQQGCVPLPLRRQPNRPNQPQPKQLGDEERQQYLNA